MDRNRSLTRLAARQRGLLTTRQILASGITEGELGGWVRKGHARRIHRGVYLLGVVLPALGAEQAALLATGPTAVLSHTTAGVLYRILPPGPGPVEVIVPGRRCRPRPGIRPHAGALGDDEIRTEHGLRVTSPARTIADLRRVLDPTAHERAHAEAQVLRLVPREHDAPGLTRSEAERKLLRLLRRARLQPAATNARLAGHEVDVLFARERLVVEVDGYAFHAHRAAFERDRRRDAELTAAGYRVIRVTWRQLEQEPEAVVARIAAILAREGR